MTQTESDTTSFEVGVLLAPSPSLLPSPASGGDDGGPDDDYEFASGGRHRRVGHAGESRIAETGHEILRAAAEAVGREVALVVSGVVAGIDQKRSPAGQALDTGSFVIDDLELKFGVKATLGTGKAVEAFFTASGEATVEVTLKLRQPGREPGH